MKITPNKFYNPITKNIIFLNSSCIANYGPQINSKLDLSDVQIPYQTQFSSNMILNAGSKFQPVLNGFLGNSVTFIMLKFTYN